MPFPPAGATRAEQNGAASLAAPQSAAEEHAAELRRPVEDDTGNDPLGEVVGETHGTDADAGDYLNS